MEVGGQLHNPAPLPLWKSPQYPLDLRLDGPQSRSGCSGEEKNSKPHWESNPIMLIAQHCTNCNVANLPARSGSDLLC